MPVPPRMVPSETVGGPRSGCVKASAAAATDSSMARQTAGILRMALSPRAGSDPWAARPRVAARNQQAPLWAWTIRPSVGSSTTHSSARRPAAAASSAPRLPVSSPIAPSQTRRTPAAETAASVSSSRAARKAASGPLVSHAPRPYSRPPSSRMANGSPWKPSTPTVSRCDSNSTVRGASSGPAVAARLGRPGVASIRRVRNPRSANHGSSQSTRRRSPRRSSLPSSSGFTLGMAIRSRSRSSAGEWVMDSVLSCHAPIHRPAANSSPNPRWSMAMPLT